VNRESKAVADIGRKLWVIPGGHMPETGTGREPEFTSRDELCVLNAGDATARLEIMVYYADREPIGPYALEVAARRVRQVRFNDLIDPEAMPLGVPFAAVVTSDAPVTVQFTRVDTRQAALAIATTMALPMDG
jgi:hypothetical protein